MVINKKTIKLRKWRYDEGNLFFELSQDEHIYQYMHDDFPKTKEDCQKLIIEFSKSQEYIRAICLEEDVIGCIGVMKKDNYAQISYWLTKEYRGQKIMTYVLKMVCSMLKNDYRIQEVGAYPFIDNMVSQKLLRSLGFIQGNQCTQKGHQVIEFIKKL